MSIQKNFQKEMIFQKMFYKDFIMEAEIMP